MRGGVLVVALLYGLMFVICVSLRLPFGFEISWMESGLLAMTQRVAAGQSIYAEPSTAYVPFIYPPLHFVAAERLGAVFPGLGGFAAMRLVSVASCLATAGVLGGLIVRAGLSLRWVAVWVGLFSAFYGRFHHWHDSSRVDSLLVLLVFASLACLIEGRGSRSALAAGGLAGLAFLTKQPALPLFVGVALALGLGWKEWRRLALSAGAAALTTVALLAMLGELGNRWFYYYMVTVPATHPLLAGNFVGGLVFLLATLPLFLLWAVLAFRARARQQGTGPAQTDAAADCGLRWAMAFAVAVVILTGLHAKTGAAVNFFLPLVPLGIMVLVRHPGPRRLREPLLLVQFLILAYNPAIAVPRADDWRAGYELLARLRDIPGDVLLPQFPGYLSMTGKAPVAHGVALCDVATLRPDLNAALEAQLRAGRYAAAADWVDQRHPANCRARFRDQPGRRKPIPSGGDFFNLQHRTKIAVLFRVRGDDAF